MAEPTETYKNYTTRFRENSSLKGLRYALSHALAAIPASIGHLLDTLLRLDGLFVKGSKAHLAGFFGLLFGAIPFVVGLLVGGVLQLVLNIPMYIGHYLLDKPIDWLFYRNYGFFTSMMTTFPLLSLAWGMLAVVTQKLPVQMNGPFGFILGAIPQLVAGLIIKVGEWVTCLPQFVMDKFCDDVSGWLYANAGKKPAAAAEPAEPALQPPKAEEVKKPRYRRPKRESEPLNQVETPLSLAKKNKEDLFAALGVTREDFEKGDLNIKKLYYKACLTCHPDKVTEPEKKEEAAKQYEIVQHARDVLEDKKMADQYVAWHRFNMGAGQQNSARLFTPEKVVVLPVNGVEQHKYRRPTATV